MRKSDQVNELFTALAKAQAEIKGAVKDAKNPFFNSRYADLSAVRETSREPLAKNNLCLIQTTEQTDKGLVLVTILAHSSGQYIGGEYPINPVKNDPQGLGSAMTYARRYGEMGILGIAPVDDDAEAAMGGSQSGNGKPEAAPRAEQYLQVIPQDQTEKSELGEYIIPIGKKYKDQKLKDIKPDLLANFVLWLEEESHKKNEPIKGKTLEFINTVYRYFKEQGYSGLDHE